jgi:hypothetical protein
MRDRSVGGCVVAMGKRVEVGSRYHGHVEENSGDKRHALLDTRLTLYET